MTAERAAHWQDAFVPVPTPRSRLLRRLVLTASLLVTGLAVSGCMQVNAALTISASDAVSGDVVVAAQPTAASQTGPQLTIPPTLASRVSSRPYSSGAFVGEDLIFHDLTFAEFAALASGANPDSGHYQLALRHTGGGLLTVAGSADLTQVAGPGASVKVKIVFPGPVVQTDGAMDGSAVTWTLKPGQLNTFAATAQYATAGAQVHSWSFWAMVLVGAGVLIALFLVGLALLARRRNLRKERAAAEV
jgi:hypothetical protein